MTSELRFGVVSEPVPRGRARLDRFGLSYLITSDTELPTLTQVIDGL